MSTKRNDEVFMCPPEMPEVPKADPDYQQGRAAVQHSDERAAQENAAAQRMRKTDVELLYEGIAERAKAATARDTGSADAEARRRDWQSSIEELDAPKTADQLAD